MGNIHIRISAQEAWCQGYAVAEAYVKEYGDLDVPPDYVSVCGFPLGIWIEKQRMRHRLGRVTPEQKQQLDQLQMLWTKFDIYWARSFQAVCVYRQAHGDLCIPRNHRSKDGVDLNLWLSNQRQAYKAGKLSQARIRRLDAIGMWWEPYTEKWEAMFAEAEAYYASHGNLRVPNAYKTPKGAGLGVWLYEQRMARFRAQTGKGNYDPERIRRLSAIGMEWYEDPWEKRFRLVKAYYERYGHLNIPQTYVAENGIWLGKWLYLQRKRKNQLTKEQIKKLDAIGMQWTSRTVPCAAES